jgi:HK97 gp10 family phage protein
MAINPGVTMTTRGDEALVAALRDLGKRGAENAARAAMRKTLNPSLKKARDYAPKKTGALRRSLRVSTPSSTKGKVSGRIGNTQDWVDKRTGKKPQYYIRKREEADGFLKKTFDETVPSFRQNYIAATWVEVEKRRVKRLAKGA